jgi:hypothetical protein
MGAQTLMREENRRDKPGLAKLWFSPFAAAGFISAKGLFLR